MVDVEILKLFEYKYNNIPKEKERCAVNNNIHVINANYIKIYSF